MNNHLGDTNKMVSDTPRTDARRGFHGWYTAVDAEFSEQIERELNAASKERDDALMMLGMYRMKSDEQKQRIKRLEEAGNEMHRYITVTRGLLPECTNDWRKAKEAKL